MGLSSSILSPVLSVFLECLVTTHLSLLLLDDPEHSVTDDLIAQCSTAETESKGDVPEEVLDYMLPCFGISEGMII